jgi:hypothetical protein
MKPITFPEQTSVLGPPAGMSPEECGPLPIAWGNGVFVSCWQPSHEERVALAAGAPIYLRVVGPAHPPVALTVDRSEVFDDS